MRIKFLLLSLIVALIAFASCKKTTTTTITQVDTVLYIDTTTAHVISESISADVDGSPLAVDSAAGFTFFKAYNYNNTKLFNQFYIESNDANGDNFYLLIGTLANSFPAQTYGAFGDSTTNASIEFQTPGTDYSSLTVLNPATITITSVTNSTIKGTFQGTVYLYGDSTQTGSNKKVMTNGKFSVVY